MKKRFKVIGLILCAFFVATSIMFSGNNSKVFADVTEGSSNNNTAAAEKYVPKKDYSSNLVANYKMDETSGTVCKDSSGNGNNGTYTGTTSVTDNDGTYRKINGTSDSINFNNPVIPIGKKSIKFRVKMSMTIASGTYPIIMDNALTNVENSGVYCSITSDGFLAFIFVDANGDWSNINCGVETTRSINDNKWHTILLTCTGETLTKSSVKLYVDNMAVPDAVSSLKRMEKPYSENLVLGKSMYNVSFAGSLSNVEIYNDVLEYNSISTGIKLNKTTDSIEENKTDDTLTAKVTPDDTTNKAVKWKSSDDTIARVDENTGKITAGKEGTATITATTQDGSNLSATCTVTVTKSKTPTPTTDDSDKAALNVTMTNGQVKQYNVTMNEVNKFISWYKLRSAGSGDPFYEFDITQSSNPNIKRTDYVIFDKISSFEVDDYTK